MTSKTEQEWIDWLYRLKDPFPALRVFCVHYHYFSVQQVIAFSGLIRRVSPLDSMALSMLSEVLYEELGRGDPKRVHSVLFERFVKAVRGDLHSFPIDETKVLPGVRRYVAELYRAFNDAPLPESLAAYCFLESSAVETYGVLLRALRFFGIGEHALEFFILHSRVEEEHARAANQLLNMQSFEQEELALIAEENKRLGALWNDFWNDINIACRESYALRKPSAPWPWVSENYRSVNYRI